MLGTFARRTSGLIALVAALAWAPAGALASSNQYIGEDAAQAYASFVTPPQEARAQFGDSCFINEGAPYSSLDESECLPKPGSKRTAIIWGDSSIAMYARDLKKYFAQAGYSMGQLTASQCPPVANFHESVRPLCEGYNDNFVKLILRLKPTIVVLSWCNCYDFTPAQLTATLNLLKLNGSKVVVLGSGPGFEGEARLLLADRARKNDPSVTINSSQNKVFAQILETEKSVKHTISTGAPGVRYVSVFSILCPNQTCVLAMDGTPLYYDLYHVTPLGSAQNVPRLFPFIIK